MVAGRPVLSPSEIERILHRIALEVIERHFGASLPQLYPVSERGRPIAETLFRFLAEEGHSCALTTSPAALRRGDPVLLIDDVLHTGRTLTQALLQVWAFSPSRIEVAVLVDRGHRLFPVVPDYVGLRLATTLQEYVEVRRTPKGWEVWLT